MHLKRTYLNPKMVTVKSAASVKLRMSSISMIPRLIVSDKFLYSGDPGSFSLSSQCSLVILNLALISCLSYTSTSLSESGDNVSLAASTRSEMELGII